MSKEEKQKNELKRIKRLYGEKMEHFCRNNFSTILEEEGKLLELLTTNFNESKFLYEDLDKNNLEAEFKNYIYNLNYKQKEEFKMFENPKELLSKAGYDLYECKTEEDIQSFRKYYSQGEELCTFNGGRLNRCHVFFAVKKDVDKIKREDFKEPKRQDKYGTSVISIQFTKDGYNTLSIKNRYNHRVSNPDATFSNDLDNIILGLTDSFAQAGYEQKHKSSGFEIPGYVKANDGKYYKYNHEINNIYYCPNSIIIDNFEVKKYPKEAYIVADYFIIDLKNKNVKLYDSSIKDSFIDSIGKIENIQIKSYEDTREIIINCYDKEDIIIKIDKTDNIIGYINNNVQEIGDKFLQNNRKVTTLELPNVKEIGNYFLYWNKSLTTINLPNVQKTGDCFIPNNNEITTINLPNVQKIGNCFLKYNKKLTTINLPNVKEIGEHFLYWNKSLTTINLPNVQKTGDSFLFNNEYLPDINKSKSQISKLVINETLFSKTKNNTLLVKKNIYQSFKEKLNKIKKLVR